MEEELLKQCREIEDRFLLVKSERERLVKELDSLVSSRDDMIRQMDVCAQSIEFVEKVATEERRQIKRKVEDLITSCLHEVFDDTYSVEFDYGMKRSRTSVEVYCLRKCSDGLVVRRQIDGIGGGVADAMSLPLKLIVLLNDTALDRVLIVDEPGKHLSIDHVPKFAQFLHTVSKKLGVQIIMSSHHQCMDRYADSINEVSLEGSVSRVERIR